MRLLLILPLVALLTGCGSDGSTDTTGARAPAAATTPAAAPAEGAQAVAIRDFKYDPTPLTVSVGTKVTWTNDDSAPHTVTGPGLELGDLLEGDTKSFTFTKPGTYAYVCDFHRFMKGSVVVR